MIVRFIRKRTVWLPTWQGWLAICLVTGGLNLMTRGLHARRSWMVYRKVFGPGVRVGVISCPPHNYLPAKWWQSSAGLKGVIGETIATGYEWLCDSGR